MNVGDLVRPTTGSIPFVYQGVGVVIAPFSVSCVVVFWHDKYSAEVEYKDYLEVISATVAS